MQQQRLHSKGIALIKLEVTQTVTVKMKEVVKRVHPQTVIQTLLIQNQKMIESIEGKRGRKAKH